MYQATQPKHTLVRQTRRLNLDPESSPSQTAWHELLNIQRITYLESDDERYTL